MTKKTTWFVPFFWLIKKQPKEVLTKEVPFSGQKSRIDCIHHKDLSQPHNTLSIIFGYLCGTVSRLKLEVWHLNLLGCPRFKEKKNNPP